MVLVCISLLAVIGLAIYAEKQLRRSLAVLNFVLSLDMSKSKIETTAKEHVRAFIEGEERANDEGRRASASCGGSKV